MKIDLRSDTVTLPTAEMFGEISTAKLGDDVLGDESTVQELERTAATLVGTDRALFVPSGTMGNCIAVATHTKPGDMVILDDESHILFYELGGAAAISGCLTRTIASKNGVMDPAEVDARFLKQSLHNPGTSLLCVENTHNRAGGAVIPVETMRTYYDIAQKHGAKVHLDGARIFNAAVALGVPASELCDCADSVMFCLSKGLGAPVGSILAGPSEFIERAMLWRKRLGGGMRQSGILAACGLVGLKSILPKLGDDHRRAKELGGLLQGISGISVDQSIIVTNFVMIDTDLPSQTWIDALIEYDVHTLPPSPNRIRIVLHHQITDEMIVRVAEIFRSVSAKLVA